MKIPNILRAAFFGIGKVLSSGGNTFFLIQSGLLFFGFPIQPTMVLSSVFAITMVYVTVFTQIPSLYKGREEFRGQNNLQWNWFTYLCKFTGLLQATCISLQSYLGTDTILQYLNSDGESWTVVFNVFFAASNFIAYYYFVIPKVVDNSFVIRNIFRDANRHSSSNLEEVNKSALTKTLLFGVSGVIGYSLLSYFNIYAAVSVIPILNNTGNIANYVFAVIAAYATFVTFSMSRLPQSYKLHNQQTNIMNIRYKSLYRSHAIFGYLDLVGFGIAVWASAAQAVTSLLGYRIPVFYIVVLGMPAISAIYLHYCFAIQILLDKTKVKLIRDEDIVSDRDNIKSMQEVDSYISLNTNGQLSS